MSEKWHSLMKQAIELAEKGRGCTHPNPLVGALIVNDEGEILTRGYHKKAGEPHAEINALNELESKNISAKGLTMIVTLEPCNHTGKTPPCTEAIIKSGIKRIVFGSCDTNNDVCGGGNEFLKSKEIEVV